MIAQRQRCPVADWSRWRQGWLPRSVRARLTLGVAVTVALIGLGSGLLLGLVVHSVLVGPIKGEARARAAELVTVLGATPGPSSRLATLAAPWPTVAQIADRNGRILAASAESRSPRPLG